jgi:4-hydroxy-tetrahydrodipicolinate reductase
LRVIFAGATGKTGSELARGLLQEPDIALVGAVSRRAAGRDLGEALGLGPRGIPVRADLGSLLREVEADVLLDFTSPEVAGQHALLAVRHGLRPVVGTTGIPQEELSELEAECEKRGLGAVVIPNFSFGAMLLHRFAREAVRFFPRLEIVEKHHEKKKDAPSGTALRLARSLEAAGIGTIPIHSVRLPGHVAHHEVIFGGEGEVLTLRHDTISRASFLPGVLLALRRVGEIKGVVYDLWDLLT